MRVVIHAPEGKNGKVIQHDCSLFPDDPKYNRFKLTRPHLFRDGDDVELPDNVAEYFISASWAALPGETPAQPDPNKPVFVAPESTKLGVTDTKE